ncbi:hypothetical protein [Paenibacillus ferrarius]|uniref:hypothetical protein n=1 Tax=Paenibacillus ferrarius TaxID=1469647 RepID=UPI00117C6A6E|nr:hypothetical protein [Paenibacillus ferrarius]
MLSHRFNSKRLTISSDFTISIIPQKGYVLDENNAYYLSRRAGRQPNFDAFVAAYVPLWRAVKQQDVSG